MNKRIQRGFGQNDEDDGAQSNHQYHGYTGHLSNNDIQSVNSNPNIGN